MRKLLLPAALLTQLVVAGCVQFRSSYPPIVVNVRTEANECRVTVARDPSTRPLNFIRVNQAQLLQIGREAKSRRAIVISDVTAQYKCIGAAIITMQQAGLMVDFAVWDSR